MSLKYLMKCKLLAYNRDSTFFQDIAFSINESKGSQKYNLQELVRYFKKFYLDIVELEIDEEILGLKEYLKFNEERDFIDISELIAGIAAQCVKKKFYLDIMQNGLVEDDQKVMFNILNNRIISKNDSISNDDYSYDDKIALSINIDIINNENKSLKLSNESYIKKYNELFTNHHKLEQNFDEMQQKYNDLMISSSFNDKISVDSQKNICNNQIDDYVNLSILFSEIKGKLEAKEQTLLKVRDEKDRIYLELSKKNLNNRII